MSQTTTQYSKPLPAMRGLAKEFYGWCRQGELRFQRCSDCGAWRHVPRVLCPECGSAKWQWQKSCGRGTLFTWTVATRAMHPGFQDDVPYASVIVAMEEGVRLLSDVVDCPPQDLEMGMALEVVFEAATPEVTLPRFRRAGSGLGP